MLYNTVWGRCYHINVMLNKVILKKLKTTQLIKKMLLNLKKLKKQLHEPLHLHIYTILCTYIWQHLKY